MKKTTFLITLCLIVSASFVRGQFSCENAVAITDGYSETGITTPGLGAASEAAWVTESIDCAGGYSSSLSNPTCWNQVFDTEGDDYLFSYTTGDMAGESVYFEILTRQRYVGLKAFTQCNGTSFSDCLSGSYTASTNTTLSVTLPDLEANQTIYFAIGVWSAPNDLDFDVTGFTVTPAPLGIDDSSKNKIAFFPNPVTDMLNITNLGKDTEITLYNLLSQQVCSKVLNSAENQIDISSLASGTYIARIKTGNLIHTARIIKQ